MFKYIVFLSYFLFPSAILAQLASPEGFFLQDSMKVGEEIPYVLSLKYPDDQTIVFPDSSYDFTPFEFVGKKYFNTVSSEGFSFDSVVYYLQTFELDNYQTFKLPIFAIEGADSIEVYAATDTIFLKSLEIAPDEPIKETTQYREVPLQFNYPYLIAFLAVLVCIIVAVLLTFGKQIRRKIALYRMRKAHEKFVAQYEQNLAKLQATAAKDSAEESLNFWKKYMEKLEKIPYTKLTTKEVAQYHKNLDFQNTLRNMDKNIYGRFKVKEAYNDLENLKTFADERYLAKTEEVNTK